MTQALDEADALAGFPQAEAKPAVIAPPPEIAAGRQWYMVVALTLLSIVAAVDRNAISLIGDAIKADFKLSDTELSFLIGGAFVAFSAILAFPAGWMVDTFNRKRLIGAGAVFWSIATVCSGLANSFGALFVGRAGVGFAEGVLGPAAFSMIRDGVAPERRGRAFAINGAGGFLGAALSLVVGSLVFKAAEAHGAVSLPILGLIKPWQMVFFAIGLGGIPFIVLVGLIVEPARRLEAGEEPNASQSGLNYWDAVLFIANRWRQYAPLMATSIMFGTMMSALAFLSPSLVHRNYGIPLSRVGLIVGPLTLVSALGLLTSGFLVDRLTKRGVRNGPATVALAAVALMAIPASTAPLMPSLPGFLVLYGMAIYGGGLLTPCVSVMNSRITPSRNAGKIVVLFNLSQLVIGASAGPLVAGLLSDHVFKGQHALAYGVSATGAIFILPTLATAWWLRREMTHFKPNDEITQPATA